MAGRKKRAFGHYLTLREFDSGRNNNFDPIRFIAATMVIFSHSYWVTGNEYREPLGKLFNIDNFGSLGVKIFFAISGYLITKSLFRQRTLGSFVWARTLRIFPGLFVSALFCVFIIGPLCTTLSLPNYFHPGALFNFIWRLSTLHNFPNALPGVFMTNPIPGVVNTPVWTLPAELFMYLCVLILGCIILLRDKQFKAFDALVLLIGVSFIFWSVPFLRDYYMNILKWGILFSLGGLSHIFRNKIILSVPLFISMVVVFLILFHFIISVHYGIVVVYIVLDVVIVYGLLIFAYHPKLQFEAFHKLGDLSYGLYIYAFPIQQLLVFKFSLLNPLVHFCFSFLLAAPVAALSWYFVEKPMLRLKG